MPTAAEARAMFDAHNLNNEDAAQWVADAVDDINLAISETAPYYNNIHVWLQYANDATLAETEFSGNIFMLSTNYKDVRENVDYYLGLMDIVGELFEEDGYRVEHYMDEPNWMARLFGAESTDCGRSHIITTLGDWEIGIEVTIEW